jgi:hypothetical protein
MRGIGDVFKLVEDARELGKADACKASCKTQEAADNRDYAMHVLRALQGLEPNRKIGERYTWPVRFKNS